MKIFQLNASSNHLVDYSKDYLVEWKTIFFFGQKTHNLKVKNLQKLISSRTRNLFFVLHKQMMMNLRILTHKHTRDCLALQRSICTLDKNWLEIFCSRKYRTKRFGTVNFTQKMTFVQEEEKLFTRTFFGKKQNFSSFWTHLKVLVCKEQF